MKRGPGESTLRLAVDPALGCALPNGRRRMVRGSTSGRDPVAVEPVRNPVWNAHDRRRLARDVGGIEDDEIGRVACRVVVEEEQPTVVLGGGGVAEHAPGIAVNCLNRT